MSDRPPTRIPTPIPNQPHHPDGAHTGCKLARALQCRVAHCQCRTGCANPDCKVCKPAKQTEKRKAIREPDGSTYYYDTPDQRDAKGTSKSEAARSLRLSEWQAERERERETKSLGAKGGGVGRKSTTTTMPLR